MNTIIVDIFQGKWHVETATVQLDGGRVVGVELQSGKYHPVSPSTVEALSEFWTDEYARMGLDRSPIQVVERAIAMSLESINSSDDQEYQDMVAFEDRFVNAMVR